MKIMIIYPNPCLGGGKLPPGTIEKRFTGVYFLHSQQIHTAAMMGINRKVRESMKIMIIHPNPCLGGGKLPPGIIENSFTGVYFLHSERIRDAAMMGIYGKVRNSMEDHGNLLESMLR